MSQLKRVLSFRVMLLITINSIMGTGIFFLPALGARFAGAASLLSWLLLAAFSIYISMCFAELCSMFPTAGGIYEFSKHAYGKFASFLIGWMTLIAGNITIAMLIVGAVSYLLPVQNPVVVIGVSVIALLMFNAIAYRGMRVSATMLIAFAFITLGTIFSLIVPGLLSFSTENFSPFFSFSHFSIFLAIFFIAETFFGWENPTFLAGETKDGARIMPKVLIYGSVIIAFISLLFVTASINAVGWRALAVSSAPVAVVSEVLFGSFGESLFRMLVYLAIIGSVAGWVVSAPRLVLSMAADRLFIPHLSAIHSTFKTPHRAIVFQTVASIVFVILGVGSYYTLLHLLVPILLVLYSFVVLSVVVLRVKKPALTRYYRVPFGRVGPFVIVLFFISLLVLWFVVTNGAVRILSLGASLLLLGIPLYLLLELYYNPRAVRRTNNVLTYVALFTERLVLPSKIRHELLRLLGTIKNKTILEFGCSVGTLTMQLAEQVTPKGAVYATDISEHDVHITKKRMEKQGHRHVTTYHDMHHHKRVHPNIPKVDAIVSIGSLGYVQNITAVLSDMNKRLKKNSKIVFLDYDKFFDILPNIEWLEDDVKIKKVFAKSGFTVNVERKQGFAWKYVYIYGEKVRNK